MINHKLCNGVAVCYICFKIVIWSGRELTCCQSCKLENALQLQKHNYLFNLPWLTTCIKRFAINMSYCQLWITSQMNEVIIWIVATEVPHSLVVIPLNSGPRAIIKLKMKWSPCYSFRPKLMNRQASFKVMKVFMLGWECPGSSCTSCLSSSSSTREKPTFKRQLNKEEIK